MKHLQFCFSAMILVETKSGLCGKARMAGFAESFEMPQILEASPLVYVRAPCAIRGSVDANMPRSEEHTSELQSLMRISYAVFFLIQQTYYPYTNLLHTTT